MQFLKLTFPNQEGHRLSARLDMPIDEKPVAYALFAHCFTCAKNYNAVINISRVMSAQGIAVLRFDFTGLGRVKGNSLTPTSHPVWAIWWPLRAFWNQNSRPQVFWLGTHSAAPR